MDEWRRLPKLAIQKAHFLGNNALRARLTSGNEISEAIIGKVFDSEKIRAGMSRTEATKNLTEACER
jgi:hypothetical protein